MMGPQDASDRIWLKQSVQFSVAGQVRTIEIALPLRPGASAEEIERLLRQADAGLDQMTQHLNSKVDALLDQGRGPMPWEATGPSVYSARRADARTSATPAEAGRAGGALEEARWSAPPPGAAVPVAGPPLERKQFIAEIAVLGLNPRQAMERLGLNTLEGVNLRQALEQLRFQLVHERPAFPGGQAAQAEGVESAAPEGPSSRDGVSGSSGALSRRPSPELKQPSVLAQAAPAERTALLPTLGNDLLPDDEEAAVVEEMASDQPAPKRLRERAPAPIPIRGQRTLRSLQEQAEAQSLLERLRQIRGRLNPPSSDNLKAFRFVVEEQIGAEKTAALLRAVWNVAAPERLGPDQVAECIRWGKDDHFEDEVDLLLRLTAQEES